jgi:mono/diheme cytochrome c family protein
MRFFRALLPSIVIASAACSLPNSRSSDDPLTYPQEPESQGGAGAGSGTGHGGSGHGGAPFDFPPDVAGSGGSFSRTLALGPVVTSSRRVPAISGGTLATGTTSKGNVVVASDPETDTVWIEFLTPSAQPASIDLGEGAEPGRVAISGGVARVLLRGTGELATIDLDSATLLSRTPICAAPRGIDAEEKTNTVAVACMGGELLLLDATSGETTAQFQLDRDLRDVVLRETEIVVSRFRSAELIVLSRDGQIADQKSPARQGAAGGPDSFFTPSVAWRTVATPDGGVMVLHQRGSTDVVQISQPGGYGGLGCGGVIHPSLSVARYKKLQSMVSLSPGLIVDVAVSSDGRIALAVANKSAPFEGGSSKGFGGSGGFGSAIPCNQDSTSRDFAFSGVASAPKADYSLPTDVPGGGDVVAVAFAPSGVLVAQHRNPARLEINGKMLALGAPTVADTGHTIFHADSGAGMACASCHPEGTDDGRVWNFEKLGARRTQPLQGGLKGTEPFHWSGDMTDFDTLVNEVFVHRMGGPSSSKDYDQALLDWMDTIPALPAAVAPDADAAARGQALFEDSTVGCTSCHSGARLSNNATVNVGTGGPFQVPTLRGLAYRAPYLHDGSAHTLKERFGTPGGGDLHGTTSQLSPGQIDDLIAYLETL